MERNPPAAYRIVVEGPSADRRAASGVDTNGATTAELPSPEVIGWVAPAPMTAIDPVPGASGSTAPVFFRSTMDASAVVVATRVCAGVMALAHGLPRTGRPMSPYRNMVVSVAVTDRLRSATRDGAGPDQLDQSGGRGGLDEGDAGPERRGGVLALARRRDRTGRIR